MQNQQIKNSKVDNNQKEVKVPKKRGRPFGSISNKTKKMLAEKRALKAADALGAEQQMLDL